MVRPKEIRGSPKQVNLNLETTLYEEFERLLPRKKSVSEAIREYMQETVNESKKVEAPEGIPILQVQFTARQTTITEYDIKLFQPSEQRMQNLNNLTKEQRTKLAIDVIHLQNQIRAIRK
jgi:metal-responsive CopG/Arc/MetJ family transcriptional regulator